MAGKSKRQAVPRPKNTTPVNLPKNVISHIDRIHDSPVGRRLGGRSRDAFVTKIIIGFILKHDANYDAYQERLNQLEREYFMSDDERIKGATEGDLD